MKADETGSIPRRPVRIANCSGFYGDRLSAAREMVEGGPIDVLTGDWLAELTMLILAKNRMRDSAGGYATTFITQLEEVMGLCLERGIRVVSNAGGLNPSGCARAVEELATRLGLGPRIVWIEGDDLSLRWPELMAAGATFDNVDTGEPLGAREVLTANAYLGGWGIAAALEDGADIVITGRTTDAALTIGPAVWHHGWKQSDFDELAGALVAGHVIECGAQATGGNYSFFTDVPGLEHPGFPIAEIALDGSSTITKHPGHGGLVSIGTVTAQLLYEIGSPHYLNPDVAARFDSITLTQLGPDRVGISGVQGAPPPTTSKVCINLRGGYRTTVELMLTGLDIEAKAELAERSLWACFPDGRDSFESTDVSLLPAATGDPASNDAAVARLRVTVKDRDEAKVGRAFSSRVTELALANYPGLFLSVAAGMSSAYGIFWPSKIPSAALEQIVVRDGRRTIVPCVIPGATDEGVVRDGTAELYSVRVPAGPSQRLPLGRIVGARSGDKGGNANVGLWVSTPPAYAWLREFLTVERLKTLMPEARDLPVERYELPNILSINFVVSRLLGEGVASSTRLDPQAKGLGEYLRAKVVDIPEVLLSPHS